MTVILPELSSPLPLADGETKTLKDLPRSPTSRAQSWADHGCDSAQGVPGSR